MELVLRGLVVNISMSSPARPDLTRPRDAFDELIYATTGPIDNRSSLMGSYIPSTVNGTNTHPCG